MDSSTHISHDSHFIRLASNQRLHLLEKQFVILFFIHVCKGTKKSSLFIVISS